MFAPPPPPQLSVQEVQRRLAHQRSDETLETATPLASAASEAATRAPKPKPIPTQRDSSIRSAFDRRRKSVREPGKRIAATQIDPPPVPTQSRDGRNTIRGRSKDGVDGDHGRDRSVKARTPIRSISSPIVSPSTSPETKKVATFGDREGGTITHDDGLIERLPEGFGEHPRRAPAPPARKAARSPDVVPSRRMPGVFPGSQPALPTLPAQGCPLPSLPPEPPGSKVLARSSWVSAEDVTLPPMPGSFPEPLQPPSTMATQPEPPMALPPPPPPPAVAPRRALPSVAEDRSDALMATTHLLLQQSSVAATADQSTVLKDGLDTTAPDHQVSAGWESIAKIPRSWTAPPSTRPLHRLSVKSLTSRPGSTRIPVASVRSSTFSARVRKVPAVYRSSAAATIRAALQDLDELNLFRALRNPPKEGVGEGTCRGSPRAGTSELRLPWKRRRRGETMSMLLEAGFFPVKNIIANDRLSSVPLDNFSPTFSIVGTPIDFYSTDWPPSSRSPRLTRSTVARRGRSYRRSRGTVSSLSRSTTMAGEMQDGDRTAATATDWLIDEPDWPPADLSLTAARDIASEIADSESSAATATPTAATTSDLAPVPVGAASTADSSTQIASSDLLKKPLASSPLTYGFSDEQVLDSICDFFDEFGFGSVSWSGDSFPLKEAGASEKLTAAEAAGRFSSLSSESDKRLSEDVAIDEIVVRDPTLTPATSSTGGGHYSHDPLPSRKSFTNLPAAHSSSSGPTDALTPASAVHSHGAGQPEWPPIDQGFDWDDDDDDNDEVDDDTAWYAAARIAALGKGKGKARVQQASGQGSTTQARVAVRKRRGPVATASSGS